MARDASDNLELGAQPSYGAFNDLCQGEDRTGLRLWALPARRVVKFLEDAPSLVRGKRVVELGCGAHAALARDPRWDVLFLGFTEGDAAHAIYGDHAVHAAVNVSALSAAPRAHGGGLFAYALRARASRITWQLTLKLRVLRANAWEINLICA